MNFTGTKYLRHEPCPKCHSRDNRAVYTDHTFCFGCGYWTPVDRDLWNSRQIGEDKDAVGSHFTNYTFSTDIPPKPLNWLRGFGITDDEIMRYDIVWEEERQLLCFPRIDSFGEIVAFNGRYFGEDKSHPKYIQKGSKDVIQMITTDPERGIGIFCEDFVSAIKLGRWYVAMPVLGSAISLQAIKTAAARFDQLGVWLDPDMNAKSLKTVSNAAFMAGIKMFRVRSDLDPKAYPNPAMRQFVEIARKTIVEM